jgi:hypothetical protein
MAMGANLEKAKKDTKSSLCLYFFTPSLCLCGKIPKGEQY